MYHVNKFIFDDYNNCYRSVLTEQLLLRINDEDIKLRNEAMLLFCYLGKILLFFSYYKYFVKRFLLLMIGNCF